MNYYKHYIGDFQRDTSHLSLTERGAYRALMDHYYATEKPLPNDHAALCRIAGAMSKQERAAVKAAMAFFEVMDSGLVHKRIEAELQKAEHRADTNREIALQREAKRRAESGARTVHEQSTIRADDVTPIVHENSTSPVSNIQEESKSRDAAPEPPSGKDPRGQIFDLGAKLLGKNGRSIIGKALKTADETKIGAVLGEMAMREKADPIAYFQAAIKPKEDGFVC